MKSLRTKLTATTIALMMALWALIAPASLAQVGTSVKNGFQPCQGANCDNIFILGGTWKIGSTAVTATAAELNALAGAGLSAAEAAVLGGVTATAAEINKLAGVTAGTVTASKALVVDANSALDVVRTASLRIGTSGSETTVARTGAEINLLAQGVAASYKIARGDVTLDGSNPTTAATGLATVVACTAAYKGTSAPALDPTTLSVNPDGTNVDIYAWKVTAQGDTTLIASTNSAAVVSFICVGT